MCSRCICGSGARDEFHCPDCGWEATLRDDDAHDDDDDDEYNRAEALLDYTPAPNVDYIIDVLIGRRR